MAAVGAVAGVLAKLADGPWPVWVSDLADRPGLWVLALALIGARAPRRSEAAGWSATAFTAMCAAYYTWSAAVLGFGVGRYPLAWIGLALTVVPVLAVAVNWAVGRSGWLPGLVLAAVAGLALSDGSLQQLWLQARGHLPPGFPLHPVQAALNVLIAGVILVLLPRHLRTRTWGLALVVPATLLVTFLVDRAQGLIGRL
ncbi:hypothetical protein BH23ACT9_BH23ACT9_13580 [soil metagenome]